MSRARNLIRFFHELDVDLEVDVGPARIMAPSVAIPTDGAN